RDGKCWVKLTGSYRITGEQQPPYNDVIPYGQALVSAAPNRMLWGSDWPHPSYYGVMPNDGYLLDQLVDWTSDDKSLIKKILVENPAELYGFE
ncbi:MAG: amidohydrolase family protein, partial [Burkholderiaceae bacterium]